MSLELLKDVNVQQGLKELGSEAYTFAQNMRTRVDTPVLDDGTDTWEIWLDSKTNNDYGGVNEDNRHRFRINQGSNLSTIISSQISSDGSIASDEKAYNTSEATEFIIIEQEILGTDTRYAIRADKYEDIREALNQARDSGEEYSVEDLVTQGGFQINTYLNHDEIIKLSDGRSITDLTNEEIDNLSLDDIEYVHDGWLEHAVGESDRTDEDYLVAAQLLGKYVKKADEEGCFRGEDKEGMYFAVNPSEDGYKVRPWYVDDSDDRSDADVRVDFSCGRHFFGVGSRRRRRA